MNMNLVANVTEWKDATIARITEGWTSFVGTDAHPLALLAIFLAGFVSKIVFDVYFTWRRGRKAAKA